MHPTPWLRSTGWERTLYLLTSVPFGFLVFGGLEYGGAAAWAVPLLLCVVQAAKPTKAGWWAVFALYCLGAGAYGVLLVRDLVRLVSGADPEVLVDANDSFVFITIEVVLVLFVVALVRARRGLFQQNQTLVPQ